MRSNPKRVHYADEIIDSILWNSAMMRINGPESLGYGVLKDIVRAEWAKLRLAWGVPSNQTIDEFVCDEIEGRGHKFVRAHRNIEARY